MHTINLTVVTFLRGRLGGVKCIHAVVQWSSLSIPRTFLSSWTETLHPWKDSFSPPQTPWVPENVSGTWNSVGCSLASPFGETFSCLKHIRAHLILFASSSPTLSHGHGMWRVLPQSYTVHFPPLLNVKSLVKNKMGAMSLLCVCLQGYRDPDFFFRF